jgi:hypothetical protein
MADNVIVSNTPLTDYTVATIELDGKQVQLMLDKALTNIIDTTSSPTEYYGAALPGTATSAASWRIMKKSVSGSVTTYAWAGGAATFVNIWDNRASLSYS